MRAAPPAQAALSGGQAERLLVVLLHLGTALVLLAWLSQRFELPWLGLALALPLGMAGLGWWLARRMLPAASTAGALRWDGQHWSLLPPTGQALPVPWLSVQLDLGPWLLLRLRLGVGAEASPRHCAWRVLTRSSAGAAWHGMRVALQAHAGQSQPVALPGQGASQA